MGARSLRATFLLIIAALLAVGCVPGAPGAGSPPPASVPVDAPTPSQAAPQEPRYSTTPVLVSGPSPFANCTLGGAGKRYVNGDVESWVAVNPLALKEGRVELLGAWMADRWSNGGGSGLVTAYSPDGGTTWSTAPLAFNGCSPNGLTAHGRASDPWVSFGPDGRAYAAALIVDHVRGHAAIGAAASADGGRTWGDYAVLQEERQFRAGSGYSGIMVDKEAVTADPVRPGTAYMVWTRNDAYGQIPAHGSIMLAKTVDGGKTWSKPETIWAAPDRSHAVGSVIWADPRDGTLYHITRRFQWPENSNESETTVIVQRSEDAGQTWTSARDIAVTTNAGVVHTASGQEVRTGGALPLAAIDPRTGRIYVVWEDARWEEGVVQTALSYSDDKGETWTEPQRASLPAKAPGFRPTVAVNSQGQVGVIYYAFPDSDSAGQGMKTPTRLYLALYSPTEKGLGQPREIPVGKLFDLQYAPMAPGAFLGDYVGLIGVGEWFHVFYVAAGDSTENPSDVYAVSVKP